MTDKELKKLKDDLWHSADILRAVGLSTLFCTVFIRTILFSLIGDYITFCE